MISYADVNNDFIFNYMGRVVLMNLCPLDSQEGKAARHQTCGCRGSGVRHLLVPHPGIYFTFTTIGW